MTKDGVKLYVSADSALMPQVVRTSCSYKDVFLVDLDRLFGNSGCIIMASGQGKRFGSNKIIAEYHGQPLIKWILDITKDLFAKRLVVTIHQDIEKLCTEYSITIIMCPK